jgi:uncharacterized protein
MSATYRQLFFILCCLPLSIADLSAQSASKKTPKVETVNLRLIARYYGDSAVLRWGFDAPWAWKSIDKAGFIIERVELDDKNKPMTEAYQKVATVKSWTLNDFETRALRSDSMAMVAAQCLHGKNFSVDLGAQTTSNPIQSAAMMSENRFRIAQFSADMSPVAAEGLGWRWVDKNVKANRKYIYRLHSPQPVAQFFNVDTTGFILPTEQVLPLLPPQYFRVLNGDKSATITWSHDRDYTAYWIEKSTDGKTFTPAVSAPYISFKDEKHFEIMYRDSLVTNYQSVFYRVRGINPFGDLSAWSTPVSVKGRDLTPPPAPTVSKSDIDEKTRKLSIEWTMESVGNLADLKGFHVSFAPNLEKPFVKVTKTLLPKTSRQFDAVWDKNTNRGYYKIIAVDTAGNEAASYFRYLFLHDLDPPSQPVGLKGKIDTNGVVRLTWAQPIESDVQGYTIQFANASDHDFVPTGGDLVEDTTFLQTITLRTLTEKIYYRIAAVDRNQNVSPFSEVLTLKKPDKIRPVAPNFKDYSVNDSVIFIAWHPSTSSDAVKQRIYRRLVKNTKSGDNKSVYTEGSKIIAEFDNNTDKFTDIPPTTDLYTYTVEAEDDDGLRSIDGDTLTLKLVDNKKLKASPKLSAKFDEKTKTVSLTWQFNSPNKLRYALYRAVANEPMEQIKLFGGEVLTFDDPKIKAGTTYRYAIKALDNEDRESNFSEAVSVLTK